MTTLPATPPGMHLRDTTHHVTYNTALHEYRHSGEEEHGGGEESVQQGESGVVDGQPTLSWKSAAAGERAGLLGPFSNPPSHPHPGLVTQPPHNGLSCTNKVSTTVKAILRQYHKQHSAFHR